MTGPGEPGVGPGEPGVGPGEPGTGPVDVAGGAVEITVDGRPVPAAAGVSVAAALLASGRRAWRTTPAGQPRGLFCGIGMCFDCTATVDGVPGVRTCLATVHSGMQVSTGAGR